MKRELLPDEFYKYFEGQRWKNNPTIWQEKK